MIGFLISILPVFLSVLCVHAIFWLIAEIRQQKRQKPRRRWQRYTPQTNTSPQQAKLLNMLAGDRAAAQRLVSAARTRYPGHRERWYWEKALYDLERDRR